MSESTTRSANPRQFNPKNGLIWATIVWSVVLGVWSIPCQASNLISYFVAVSSAALVCLCFWEAHVHAIRHGFVSGFPLLLQVAKRGLVMLLAAFGASALSLFVVVMFSPHYSCYTDRAKVSEVILSLSSQREEITQRIQTSKTIANSGVGISITKLGRVVGGLVTESGTMVVVSEDPPAVVMFTPEFIKSKGGAMNGEVKWTCVGYPEKAMPMLCRQ